MPARTRMHSPPLLPRLSFVLAAAIAGCGDEPAPPFAAGGGEAAVTLAYPSGPYGRTVGSTVRDYDFFGYPNPAVSSDALQRIQLADFYNPHAFDAAYHPASAADDDRLFPPGSPHGAGRPRPTVLAL